MLSRSSGYKKRHFIFLGKVRYQSATLHDIKILEECNLKIAEAKASNVCFFTFVLFLVYKSQKHSSQVSVTSTDFLNTSYQ